MKRPIVTLIAAVAVACSSAAASADPSDACNLGFLPSSATPAGAGLRLDGQPGKATLTACNSGAVVPAPGYVRAVVDTGAPSVLLVVDGDPESALLECSDGYMAVRAGNEGVALYENGDGGYTSRARPKSAQDFATDLIAHCTAG